MTTAFSCGRNFGRPFDYFPILIFDDDQTGTKLWLEIFSEATVIHSLQELFVALARDIRNNGALVIYGSTYSPLCRDSFLNAVAATVDVAIGKKIDGFYIDDIDNNILRTPIAYISPRQILQVSGKSPETQTLINRSFWINSLANKDIFPQFLEGQLYPALVTRPFKEENKPPQYGIVLLLIFILLVAVVYCLVTLYL